MDSQEKLDIQMKETQQPNIVSCDIRDLKISDEKMKQIHLNFFDLSESILNFTRFKQNIPHNIISFLMSKNEQFIRISYSDYGNGNSPVWQLFWLIGKKGEYIYPLQKQGSFATQIPIETADKIRDKIAEILLDLNKYTTIQNFEQFIIKY